MVLGIPTLYWILELEGEVHSNWDLWISGLKGCKSNNFFLKLDGAGKYFRSGPKDLDFFSEGLPLPVSTSLEKLVGGILTPAILNKAFGPSNLVGPLAEVNL